LKIFQLIQKPQFRGVELFTCQLAQELEAQGHSLKIIPIFEGIAKLPFKEDLIPLKRSIGFRFIDFRGWFKLYQLIQEHQPDIIQANAADTLKYAVFSKILFGWKVPIVYRNASMVSLYIKSLLVKYFNSRLYSNVDAIISVSHHSRLDLQNLFPTLRKKHVVIPIGVNVGETIKKSNSSDYPVLIHIGGFSFEKNHKGLLRIFQSFLRKHSKAQLLLFGEGILKEDIVLFSKEMGIANNIKFKGLVDKPFNNLPFNAIFVLPSIIEGLPAVILEAMWHGFPVIAYDVGGISEVVKHKKTGWLIPKDSEQEFEIGLEEILNYPSTELEKITTEAKKMVLENYTMEKVAGEFERVYGEVIRRK
jgi:L-malate glycosyltransferase